MKLRTRLDLVSAALLSALGASSVVACGGTFTGGEGGPGGGSAGAGNAAGAPSAGAGGRIGVAGAGAGGAPSGGAPSGGAGGGQNQHPCLNPKDLGNGVIQCDGFTHRTETATCPSKLPRPEAVPAQQPMPECAYDADCTAHPNGYCDVGGGGQVPGPFCSYGCTKDNECTEGQICLCGDPVGRCVSASCTTDASCAAGSLCRSYDSTRGCQFTSFICQNPADECGSDAECAKTMPGLLCSYDTTLQHFRCEQGGCAIGRPFLVEGEQRLAPITARADWSELEHLPLVQRLDAALSARLAEQWLRVAAMEHASIAAFARFSLQLMSLGAPAELIERATAAMADETKHAKACFAVASSYAGSALGPGRLAVDSSLDEMSLEQIVLNTIREGCVGETVAAIEAREAAEHAADPALRSLLLTISEDETRHAELAFRFVQWALAEGGAALERSVRAEFSALAAEPTFEGAPTPHGQLLLEHGIVPEAMRQVIRARAISDVIVPCASALYSGRRAVPAATALDAAAC